MPTAVATWATPVSPHDHAPAGATMASRSSTSVRPDEHRGRRQRRPPSQRFAEPAALLRVPVITTRRPAASLRPRRLRPTVRPATAGPATRRPDAARRRRTAAAPAPAAAAHSRQVVGVGREAGGGDEAAPAVHLVLVGRHSGPVEQGAEAKATSRRGRGPSSSRWLCGPAAVEVDGDVRRRRRRRAGEDALASTVSTTRSARPACRTSGAKRRGASSTSSWPGGRAAAPAARGRR